MLGLLVLCTTAYANCNTPLVLESSQDDDNLEMSYGKWINIKLEIDFTDRFGCTELDIKYSCETVSSPSGVDFCSIEDDYGFDEDTEIDFSN